MITKQNLKNILKIVSDFVKDTAKSIWVKIYNNPAIVRSTLAGLASAGLLTISDADLNTVNTLTVIVVSILGGAAIRPSVKPLKKKPAVKPIRNARRKKKKK